MGIELPAPSGGSGESLTASRPSIEDQGRFRQPELSGDRQNVEIKSTERPASQESKSGAGAGDGAPSVLQNGVAVTTNTGPVPQPTVAASLDDVPAVAADEDQIEKQWVDLVKRAVTQTRHDPYLQSEAISRLQADYLQKRYGKTIGQGSGA